MTMGKTFCAFHPTVPASWYCDACDAYYCNECISRREIGGGMGKKATSLYLCPKCSCTSERLAVQNLVEPFWLRLPKFFTYPFRPAVMVFILIIALLMALFSAPSLLSVIIQMALFGVLMKYCFAVLKATAEGGMIPPDINERTITEDFNIVTKYWVLGFLYVLAGVACFFLARGMGMALSPMAAIAIFFLLLIGLLLIAPASIMVLVANESLLDAVNPMIFLRMAFRIGPSYFLMYFFLIIIYAAPGVVGYFVQPHIPELAFAFIVSVANCYYSIVAHHLMGYVILQHHEDIGYDVDVGEEEMERISGHARPHDAGHALLSRVNVLIKSGRYDDAMALIQEETGGDIRDLELAERYHNLLKMGNRVPELLAHGQKYLSLLIGAKKEAAYRALYLECASLDPRFNPPASVLFRVARSLSEAGNDRPALEAYNRFIQACPDDPMAPKAYLMAATIFHEKLNSPDRAAKTLRKLIKSYPDHDIIPYAAKYLRKLEGEM
jgi:tetratricopeptide (TPR) repeat protein